MALLPRWGGDPLEPVFIYSQTDVSVPGWSDTPCHCCLSFCNCLIQQTGVHIEIDNLIGPVTCGDGVTETMYQWTDHSLNAGYDSDILEFDAFGGNWLAYFQIGTPGDWGDPGIRILKITQTTGEIEYWHIYGITVPFRCVDCLSLPDDVDPSLTGIYVDIPTFHGHRFNGDGELLGIDIEITYFSSSDAEFHTWPLCYESICDASAVLEGFLTQPDRCSGFYVASSATLTLTINGVAT